MNPFQRNAIKFEFTRMGLTEIGGMNLLDENGLISNNVIELEDISTKDATASINWLRQQENKPEKNLTS